MLTNQYTSFGNNMLEKYAGMVSAINPLSLFYLKSETKEDEIPVVQSPSVTYVQNRIQNINHHHYHTMANRYMINYQNTMNLIAANPVYEKSPNFKREIMPANLIHTQVPKSEEETKEETKEIIKTLVKQVVSEYKETLVKEQDNRVQVQNFLTVLSEIPSMQQRILPVLEKNIHTVWVKYEKEAEKVIVKEMATVLKEVMEQAAQKLPDQYRKRLTAQRGQNLRMQAQEMITQKEVIYLAETITKQMTVKTEEIRKQNVTEVSKITELSRTSEINKQNIVLQSQKIQQNRNKLQHAAASNLANLTLSVQQKQRMGKERFQTQIMGRISPLPVRPTALFFPKEKQAEAENIVEQKENTDAVIVQKINYVMKKETAAEHKYYTHLLERFLHKDEKVRTQEIDRSKEPAGIIWHQKPKETIRFERREVLLLPMSLVYDKTTVRNEEAEKTTTTIINTNTIQHTSVVNTAALQVPVLAEEYGDYQARRLIRKSAPDFTRTQNLISDLQYAVNEGAEKKNRYSQITYTWKNDMLELVLPKASSTEEQNGNVNTTLLQNLVIVPQKAQISAYSGGSVSMSHVERSMNSAQGQNAPDIAFLLPAAYSAAGSAPVVPEAARQGAAANNASVRNGITAGGSGYENSAALSVISPVPLVYKQENDQNSQQQQEIKKIEEKTELLEDIVFEKKVITKDTRYTYNTSNESNQETQMLSHMPDGINVPTAGNTVVSRAEVDNIVSESVSRQMDINIHRISKQVYKDIDRQLKKERERRGIK
ncbi:MAG: hypothetical protein IKC46_00640 [Lachnospiraceae bacterium]|nr:hypothetical protein [Lachnospiraceae bacterium]